MLPGSCPRSEAARSEANLIWLEEWRGDRTSEPHPRLFEISAEETSELAALQHLAVVLKAEKQPSPQQIGLTWTTFAFVKASPVEL
jgi:hypothetical protein